MTILSVAIIGAGNMAGGFDEKKQKNDIGVYSHAGAYKVHGGFELKTVYDPSRERAESFCKIWKVNCIANRIEEIFDSYHDIISVCSPDSSHFYIVRDIIAHRCCRTIFVEKPLALEIGQIDELIRHSTSNGIRIVVNSQRRYEPQHREIREFIVSGARKLLSVTCHYMKGLHHIGVTMVDTISYLFGYPNDVLAYNRVYNNEIGEYSYEFILFYHNFTVSVKTVDTESCFYNYHIFEIDLLFSDKRLTLVNNSQGLRVAPVTSYSYSGVKILNEREAKYQETDYKYSMVEAIKYLYNITTGETPHEINTPQSSYNNCVIINKIIESFNGGSMKIHLEEEQWKK